MLLSNTMMYPDNERWRKEPILIIPYKWSEEFSILSVQLEIARTFRRLSRQRSFSRYFIVLLRIQ